MAGPYFLHYSNKYSKNADKILGDPSLIHLDSAQVYTSKNYLGAKLAMYLTIRIMKYFQLAVYTGKMNFFQLQVLLKQAKHLQRSVPT